MAFASICEKYNNVNIFKQFDKDEVNVDLENSNINNNINLYIPSFDKKLNVNVERDEFGKKVNINFDHGTTTLGFKYQGGIILTVDSRATGGMYIGSQTVKKVIEISDHLLGTMAGGAADCSYWERVLAKQCRLYELKNREKISVAAASKLLANILYSYKGMGIVMGVMIAGYDKKGAGLYYIDSDGIRTSGKLFSVGSGSVYAYGVLDEGYKWDLKDEEAYNLGLRSVYHATHRDAASGGIIRVYHIRKEGWTKILEQDCKNLYYNYNKFNK